ncbi:exosome complex component MTR3-like [Gigantopelta aegis]|uniref:exosome complex component MTR3-like n=1 Tax=Gigantopelta aegis TaxID=1735272 RepID=UPI001B888E88|nr:exosome complex component MTR3-like [Gigantopelta aegis]
MPGDTRRITGPEVTFNLYTFVKSDVNEETVKADARSDGRKTEEVRPLFLRAGVTSQAHGSAYIEQGQTKVICSVYGPREVLRKEDFSMKGQLTCEFKFATFSCRQRRQHQQDSQEKDYSVQILEALEPAVCLHKFPKAQVNIYITVLQNDGSALAASITCASVALADAEIEMYDLVAGCSSRVFGGHVLMDPTDHEEYRQQSKNHEGGSVTVGLMPSLNQISALTSRGEIEFSLVNKAVKQCVETCQRLYPVLQAALMKSLKHKLKETT